MTSRAFGIVARRAIVVVWAAFLLTAHSASAQPSDPAASIDALSGSPDFRVRVTAALAVGRTHPNGAREALERALADTHAPVRIAAAEALGSLGDAEALPALRQRLPVEPSASVKAQIRVTVQTLEGGEPSDADKSAPRLPSDVRYLVALGSMRNATETRREDLGHTLSEAARLRARGLRGGAVIERGSSAPVGRGAGRRLPIITIDGSVVQMVESRVGRGVQIAARVEFTIRRNQELRGTVSGGATTFGSTSALSDEARRRLQDDAVDGAVQSALRGAETGLMTASR